LGDTLLATIDQKLYSGTATGTAIARYVHPDHLGSTNVVTDASGTIAQLLDYYPYGATRVSSTTYPTNEKRQYIDQFSDTQTGLDYLNARYYNPAQGQFLSEDPVFLALGSPTSVERLASLSQKQILSNPQMFNVYSYARNNPITIKDPSGKIAIIDDAAGMAVGGGLGAAIYAGESLLTGQQMTRGGLYGAMTSGAIAGWAAVNTPETLGASDAIGLAMIVGGTSAAAGNTVKQEVNISSGVQKKKFDFGDLAVDTGFGVVTGGATEGVMPDASIPVLSSGRNSFSAIGQSTLTKVSNGTVSNISFGTGFKAAVGSQASATYQTILSILVDISRTLGALAAMQNTTPPKR
jgi:RHS repeat-associated protein